MILRVPRFAVAVGGSAGVGGGGARAGSWLGITAASILAIPLNIIAIIRLFINISIFEISAFLGYNIVQLLVEFVPQMFLPITIYFPQMFLAYFLALECQSNEPHLLQLLNLTYSPVVVPPSVADPLTIVTKPQQRQYNHIWNYYLAVPGFQHSEMAFGQLGLFVVSAENERLALLDHDRQCKLEAILQQIAYQRSWVQFVIYGQVQGYQIFSGKQREQLGQEVGQVVIRS